MSEFSDYGMRRITKVIVASSHRSLSRRRRRKMGFRCLSTRSRRGKPLSLPRQRWRPRTSLAARRGLSAAVKVSIRITGASEHDGDSAGNRARNSGTSDGGGSDGVAVDSGAGGVRELTVERTLVEVFCKGVEMEYVIVLAARASRIKNQVAIDTAIVGMLSDPKEARAGAREIHFLPFSPVDKRFALTYIDYDGNWHRG